MHTVLSPILLPACLAVRLSRRVSIETLTGRAGKISTTIMQVLARRRDIAVVLIVGYHTGLWLLRGGANIGEAA